MLTIATFIGWRCVLSVHFSAELVRKLIGIHEAVDHAGGALPVERPVAVTAGDEARARVEHLVLRMARAKFRADGVPRGLEEFHFLVRRHLRRTLGGADDLGEVR